MATFDVFSAELNKLSKAKLIDIIFNKKVCEGANLSVEVQKIVNSWTEPEFQDSLAEINESNLTIVNMQSQIEILKVKLNAEKQSVSHLKSIIDHQATIISLLQNKNCKNNKAEEKKQCCHCF